MNQEPVEKSVSDGSEATLTVRPGKKRRASGAKNRQEERDLVRQVHRRHQAAVSASIRWRNSARRALSYYEGDQRPPEARADEDSIYVTLNLIRDRTDTKVGILTSGKPKAVIQGRELGDERAAAGVRDLFEYSSNHRDTRFDLKLKRFVADQVKVGMGVGSEELSFEAFQHTQAGRMPGELALEEASPLDFYIDPANRSSSMWGKNGPSYYTIESWVPAEELELMYPHLKSYFRSSVEKSSTDRQGVAVSSQAPYTEDFARNVQHGEGDDKSNNNTMRQYGEDVHRVLTMWYQKRIPIERAFMVDEDGNMVLPSDGDGGFLDPEDIPKEERDQYEVIRQIENQVWTCAVAGDMLLYNHTSPYKHGRWPHVFFCGQMHHDEPMPYGEIHRLLDAQDVYNKINSLVIDNAIRTNNTGWKFEEGALDEDQEQKLEVDGAQPGLVLRTRAGHLENVQRLEPGQLSDALYRIQNDLRVLFDELSSLYQTQRGGMPYDTSGKAIIALQQAGDMALIGLQQQIEEAVTAWGEMRLSNIFQFYTAERAWRISDRVKEESTTYLTQLQPNVETGDNTLHLYKLEDQNPEPLLLLRDFNAAEYDIKITMGTGHERSREQKLEEARLVYEATGYVPYLLQEMGVENKREILLWMEKRDQLKAVAQMVEQSGLAPDMIMQVGQLMQDETMGMALAALLQNPQMFMRVLSESPTFMQAASTMPLEGQGQLVEPAGGTGPPPEMAQPQGPPPGMMQPQVA